MADEPDLKYPAADALEVPTDYLSRMNSCLKGEYSNCKIAVQETLNNPELTGNRTKVSEDDVIVSDWFDKNSTKELEKTLRPGDVLDFRGSHYAIYEGSGSVVQVPGWGEKPERVSLRSVLDYWSPPTQIISATDEPRPTDKSKLPAVIDAASVASQLARTQADDPRPKGKGEMFRGLGSLMRSRVFPLIQAVQMGYKLLPEDKQVAGDVLDYLEKTKTHELFGLKKSGLEYFKDLLGFSEQPRPNTHEDLSLPELITGYAIAPAKRGSTRSDAVTREELVSRLRSNPELQKVSQKALKDLGYNKGTIPLFRVTLTPEGGFKSEGVVSTSLTPESHLDTIKYFTEGKISPFDITPRLIRYDVPIEKIIGYLPAFKDQIKRGVNKAVKAKGMGQRALKGFSKVGDPARHAKNLLDKEKEVLVDVTGISPTFMKVFDAQESKETFVNPLSIRMSRIEKIGRGQIKTPEDYRRDMGGNETYFDYESAGKLLRDLGKDRFRQLENEHMQKEIEHYKKFFGKAAGGFVDKPLYEDARMVG